MKKTIVLALATMLATVSFAQQQIATLNHNDSVSVFYGTTALQQAYDSAVNGDVILLSSGAFNQISIEKSITIRGNGIIRDTIADAEPTIINGCSIGGGIDNPVSNIVIEGVRFASSTYFYRLVNPTFRKCMFDLVYCNQANVQNGVFVNCIIHQYHCNGNYNTQFVNSIVNFDSWSSYSNGCSMINCIAYLTPSVLAQSQQNIPDLTCTNSVLIAPLSYINAVNPLAAFNCIGIKSNGYFENSASGNNNFSSLSSVFKDFSGLQNGKFIETEFELQDSIATNILGSDGTQIGVYGGMAPFTPRVTTPRYVRCNVAPHTNSDGKLSVDVEVVSE